MATPFQYTPEEDAEIDRRARRYLAEEAEVAKLQDREERAKAAREGQARENLAGAAVATSRLQRPSAATGYRSKYTGPVANRGVDAQGRALVSREELADFQRKYGADKTLRDLLNADRGVPRRGAPTSSATDMRARGVQGANIAPEQPTLRSLLGTAAPEDKEDALQRIAGRQPSKSPEQLRDEAKNNTLAALSLMGGLGANVAGRAIASRIAGRAAATPAATSRGALVREAEDIPAFKRGGKVKAYAKGGSVKGSGCEQRGLRKCKVY